MSRSLRIVTAVTLSTAMAFAISAIAADLPKEGTYKGTYTVTAQVLSEAGWTIRRHAVRAC
jgi:hypothetical protein